MSDKDYHILVISHNCFSKINNNGKTLESIFKGIQKENISQIFYSNLENPDWDFCESYFKITDYDILMSLKSRVKKAGKVLSKTDEKSISIYSNNRRFQIPSYLKPLFIIFREVLWNSNKWKSEELINWTKEQNPDFIFFVGGNYMFSHKFAYYVSSLLKIPLITYFTDDYIIYPKYRNLFSLVHQQGLKKAYVKTIEKSSLLFGIGDLMCKEYSNYYQKKFYPIMNSISSLKYDNLKKGENNLNIIKISYFGGLHLNRWKMIAKLGKIINENKTSFSELPEINVYTNSKISSKMQKIFESNNIRINKPLLGDKLIQGMLNSDILLHVESDEKYYKSLTKLSVSTKIPEYLLTKKCVLGYGPSDVASLRLLNDNKIGIVLDSKESNDTILKKLLETIQNTEERKNIGILGYQYAKDKFDSEVITNYFMEKIHTISPIDF